MSEHDELSKWAALADPRAHPFDPSAKSRVERSETHISQLFFSGDRVYKFRKPVDLGFLDFTTLAERNEDCLREVVLNRRLAPDVYLGVAPLFDNAPTGPFIGHVDESLCGDVDGPFEHCVVMRRLPHGSDAESQLHVGRFGLERIEALATILAQFHETHRLMGDHLGNGRSYFAHLVEPARQTLAALEGRVSAECLDRVVAAQIRTYERARAWLERRRQLGFGVDGHGDLRLEHIWFEDDRPPVVIDCVEFDADLRRSDPANDVGFLVTDMLHHGARTEAELFVQHYVWATDDYGLLPVLDHFGAYAAEVRAKVAAIEDAAAARAKVVAIEGAAEDAAEDADEMVSERAEERLEQARQILERSRRPMVFVLAGLVGTGKSTVARAIAAATGGIIVCSDRVRKRLAALISPDGAIDDDVLYDDRQKREVYDGLIERADAILESGRPAILDASFDRVERRQEALELACEWDCPIVLVETVCAPEIARMRLAERQARGDDPSDAGPERYAASERAFEPIEGVPVWDHWVIDTGRSANWLDELGARLLRLD